MSNIKSTEFDSNTGIEPIKVTGQFQYVDTVADALINYSPSLTLKAIGLSAKLNNNNIFDLGESEKAYEKINVVKIIETYTSIEDRLVTLSGELARKVDEMRQLYADSINLGGVSITEYPKIKDFVNLVYLFNNDYREGRKGEMVVPNASFLLEQYFGIQKNLNDKKRAEVNYVLARARKELFNKFGNDACRVTSKEEILKRNYNNVFARLSPEGRETLNRAMKKVVWDRIR